MATLQILAIPAIPAIPISTHIEAAKQWNRPWGMNHKHETCKNSNSEFWKAVIIIFECPRSPGALQVEPTPTS